MNLSKAIGGYFERAESVPANDHFLHEDAVLLHSGRACLEYVLQAQRPTRVWMPYYICGAMMEPIERLGIQIMSYEVDDQLHIGQALTLGTHDMLVYVNYFGLYDQYCQKLTDTYKSQLILDYSQAYFSEPLKSCHTLYSPRKFFGVPDGGCLYTSVKIEHQLPQADSSARMNHLVLRAEQGPEAGYEAYQKSEAQFSGEPLMTMSPQAKDLLHQINFREVSRIRNNNFAYLHDQLQGLNKLQIPETWNGPLCYPFMGGSTDMRQRLLDHRIFVPTYWPDVVQRSPSTSNATRITQNLLPLPIDQRYDREDMKRIVEVLHG